MNGPKAEQLQVMARVQTRRDLVLNACGTMVGAGIYTMTGKMAATTGYATVLAYLVGLAPTLLVSLVYAALATRFPRASSLAHWLQQGLGSSWLSFLGGSASVCLYMFAGAGTTLGAALTCFKWAGYAAAEDSLVVVAACVLILVVSLVLNLCGLEEASMVLMVCTYLELFGLVIIILAVALMPSAWASLLAIEWTLLPAPSPGLGEDLAAWCSQVIAGGAFVVFSFGGFETIGSQSEETQNPQRDLPAAFGISVAVVALLNMLIMVASLCVIHPAALATSPDPLTDVMEQAVPWLPREVFTMILLASAFNSVLGIQIHVSRTLWGMAHDGCLPATLGATCALWRANRPQPHIALVCTAVGQAVLLIFGLLDLGRNCASLLVISFILAHCAYIGIRHMEIAQSRQLPSNVFTVGMWVPVIGLGVTGFIMYHALSAWGFIFPVGWLAISTAIWAVNQLNATWPRG
ncbi:unnamed protein product [Effrenium voratum]|nr:unnamed protein product [Effrenium voratum]